MVLREVHLDLVDRAKCKYVLQTLKSSMMNQRLVRPQPSMTVLCAGPETGGSDACQVLKIVSLFITSDFFSILTDALFTAQFSAVNQSFYPTEL